MHIDWYIIIIIITISLLLSKVHNIQHVFSLNYYYRCHGAERLGVINIVMIRISKRKPKKFRNETLHVCPTSAFIILLSFPRFRIFATGVFRSRRSVTFTRVIRTHSFAENLLRLAVDLAKFLQL